MRTALIASLALLSGCGPKALTLPQEGVERAATCGVVAAAKARAGTGNVEAKLSFAQQAGILHYALIEGSEGGSFDKTRASKVVEAMQGLGDEVTSGKWQELSGPCDQAYPAAAAAEAKPLPTDALVAQTGCDALADFMTTALRASEADYIEKIRAYDDLERKLDSRIGRTEAARGEEGGEVERRNTALATMAGLGSPAATLDACVKRYA